MAKGSYSDTTLMMVRSYGCKIVHFWWFFRMAIDPKYQRVVILSRPHFCISDTPIYLVNYPEELGAILELGRVHGFSPLAPGVLLTRRLLELPFKSLRKMAEGSFFASWLVEKVFSRMTLCQICGKTSLSAPEIHYSAYDFQHCAADLRPYSVHSTSISVPTQLA